MPFPKINPSTTQAWNQLRAHYERTHNREIKDLFATDPSTLVVISSDLSHFHAYAEAQRLDASTCRRILERATDLRGDQACGARAINGLMASARSRDLDIELLQVCNSGDTAGTPDRVVGYAAFALR